MRDGFFLRSLPFFGGCLGLMQGCTSSDGANDTSTTDASTGGGTSTGPGSTSNADSTTAVAETTANGSTSDATAGTSTGGDPSCAGTCRAPAPEGWFGPTIYARVADVMAVPDCPEEYPNPGPTVLDGFHDPGPAQCDCSCNLMAGTPCSLNITQYTANCSSWLYSTQAAENCTNTALSGAVRIFTSYYYGGGGGTCQKENSEFVPPVAWDGAIRSCRLPEAPLSCTDGGVCLPPAPDGFESAWCIYKQGDVDCPGGDFGNKSVFFTNAMDTRECSSCSCGTAGTSCNEGVLQLFPGPDCAGSPTQELSASNGLCQNVTAGSFAASFSEGPPCPVTSIPEPMGEVAAVGPFTFCCG